MSTRGLPDLAYARMAKWSIYGSILETLIFNFSTELINSEAPRCAYICVTIGEEGRLYNRGDRGGCFRWAGEGVKEEKCRVTIS